MAGICKTIENRGALRVVRLFLLLFALFLQACQVELHSGLDETDANEIMAHLLNAGITTEKVVDKDKKVMLLIPESQFSSAVALLRSLGLPREKFQDMGTIFKQDSMISTPTEEWARFLYARSQELSQSVNAIEGVLSARVHIAVPKKKSLLDKAKAPSASVLVSVNSKYFNESLIPNIKQLVTFSVEELDYENVSVVITPVNVDEKGQDLVNYLGLIIHNSSVSRIQSMFILFVGTYCLLPIVWVSVFFYTKRKYAA